MSYIKKIILGFAIFILSQHLFGQENVFNLKEIKHISKTDSYNKLFDRYIANDTTLTLKEYQIIYYGQAFQSDYNASSRHDSVKILNQYLNQDIDSINFKKVLEYSQLILSKYPFNIEQIYINAIAYERLEDYDKAKMWFFKYDKLIFSILGSGTGKSRKTAMVVTKITDEYSMLNALGLQFTGQSLIKKRGKSYDYMSVADNDMNIKGFYFDISLFFGEW